jgi:hypothetical protein
MFGLTGVMCSVVLVLCSMQTSHAAPILISSSLSPPITVDLSGEGKLDWMHWGLVSGKTVNQKSATGTASGPAVGAIVADSILPVLVAQTASGPETFNWTGGTSTGSASTNTVRLIDNVANGSGIRITVPAVADLRTLNLYVGLTNETGLLSASVVNSANVTLASLTDSSFSSPSGSATRRFSINFAADPLDSLAQSLVVSWTGAQNFGGMGDLWIGGATLVPEPATLSLLLSVALLRRHSRRSGLTAL